MSAHSLLVSVSQMPGKVGQRNALLLTALPILGSAGAKRLGAAWAWAM